MNGTVGVVYLARAAGGLTALQRFAGSYNTYSAGTPHDLIIIYKGFAESARLDAARRVFSDTPHIVVELDDTGFDIGSYLETSARVSHDYLFFINTHSAIAAPDWLRHVHAYATQESCGIAGTMGSYESLQDTVCFLEGIIAASYSASGEAAKCLTHYFDFLLPRFRPDWYQPSADRASARSPGILKRLRHWLRFDTPRLSDNLASKLRGTALIWPGAPEMNLSEFPSFPNPHIRTNGFMIRRSRLLSLPAPTMSSKEDANLFESGQNSLTRTLARSGLSAIVVGAGGGAYDVPNWPKSATFRLEKQQNLLISDNHTRAYSALSEGARVAHARMTWGDYLGLARADFPDTHGLFRRADSFFQPNSSVPSNA